MEPHPAFRQAGNMTSGYFEKCNGQVNFREVRQS